MHEHKDEKQAPHLFLTFVYRTPSQVENGQA